MLSIDVFLPNSEYQCVIVQCQSWEDELVVTYLYRGERCRTTFKGSSHRNVWQFETPKAMEGFTQNVSPGSVMDRIYKTAVEYMDIQGRKKLAELCK